MIELKSFLTVNFQWLLRKLEAFFSLVLMHSLFGEEKKAFLQHGFFVCNIELSISLKAICLTFNENDNNCK